MDLMINIPHKQLIEHCFEGMNRIIQHEKSINIKGIALELYSAFRMFDENNLIEIDYEVANEVFYKSNEELEKCIKMINENVGELFECDKSYYIYKSNEQKIYVQQDCLTFYIVASFNNKPIFMGLIDAENYETKIIIETLIAPNSWDSQYINEICYFILTSIYLHLKKI